MPTPAATGRNWVAANVVKAAICEVRAPADTFSAVCPTEPPTGRPRNKPEARLAAPCGDVPVLVRRHAVGARRRLGDPAPLTKTIAATASAPVTRLTEESPAVHASDQPVLTCDTFGRPVRRRLTDLRFHSSRGVILCTNRGRKVA